MVFIVAAIASLSLGLGVYGLVSPAGMKSLVSRFDSRAGLSTAVALRLILAVALWRVAPASRAPAILQGLAVVSAATAVTLTLGGFSRYQALLAWWSRQSVAGRRLSSAMSVALGAFLLWSMH